MRKILPLIILFFAGLIISGIAPKERFTWWLEVMPALLGFAVLSFTYRRFRFTQLTYWMILLHCFVLFLGAHYTYAEVPLFDWIRDTFGQARNNYDKLGHFAQGFIPAFIARELLIRKNIVHKKGWLAFIVVCICMAVSVIYEFIEWAVAVMSGESAESFLGTQGYVWDTQSDMLYATIGAIVMAVSYTHLTLPTKRIV